MVKLETRSLTVHNETSKSLFKQVDELSDLSHLEISDEFVLKCANYSKDRVPHEDVQTIQKLVYILNRFFDVI